MSDNLRVHFETDVRMGRDRVLARRDFLCGVSTAALAAGSLRWTDAIAASSEQLRREGMACIVLWMAGGPSQFETFSPKPDHENGGETKAISTAVPGIQISENLSHCAKVMNELAIIRSMSSKEGNHSRASFLLHHGVVPTASVKYPSMGSLVAHQIGDAACELPSFVRVGNRLRNGGNGGFLGVDYDPFVLQDAERPPANTTPATSVDRYQRRLSLLDRLDARYGASEGPDVVDSHKKLVGKASQMILSPQMDAFDLDQESDATRDAYGRTKFGASCLLARRLVESGVTFVEVGSGGWDTHQDNFNRVRELTAGIDQPMAQLITDLKQRGMLERTLVVWMGEFGRTPKINGRTGRDHFPRAFNVVLAGGGVRGGQVIGETNAGGTEVTDRPVQVVDLFRSIYKSLRIDADHENMSLIGRPIKIVDGGGVVEELFS